MGNAKDITLKPISATKAKRFIQKVHYSGKVVNNSQLHMGVFLKNRVEGVMQFGPSLDKRKIVGLVTGTKWNEFLELNRLAFTDKLPRNSESRALAVVMRLIKKYAPHIKWIISFADATQCGDGTIYRASGFVLTGIKKNTQIWERPDGDKIIRTSSSKGKNILGTGGASMKVFKEEGFRPLKGFQLRYLYFIDKACRQKLTVPEIPFSKIKEMGASMYKGENAALV